MAHFGLDIGSGSIKIVQLEKEGDTYKLVAIGESKNSVPNLDMTDATEKIAQEVKRLVGELEIKTNLAVLSLPEEKVISRVIAFPPINDNEISKALYYEVETFVPYPKKDVQLDYQVIEKNKEKTYVFVVAAQKQLVEKYEKIAKNADLVPLALETTSVAMSRALDITSDKPVMIVDLGAKNSTISVIRKGNVYLTRVIKMGGDAFTRAISVSLGMDFIKAEEYKKAYGFQEGKWENKIRTALSEIFNHLAQEIKTGMLSYKEDWSEDVGMVILSGGGATMPGLTDELIKVLGVEIQIARPLASIDAKGAKHVLESEKAGSKFAVPVGLAKRPE
jgi:type IV pilus assembly protein PilM